MDARPRWTTLLLLAASVATCFGQLDLGGLMEGMGGLGMMGGGGASGGMPMGGGAGGLAGLTGGGGGGELPEGGLAAGLGGMGGMGGMSGMAGMGGMGGMSGMGAAGLSGMDLSALSGGGSEGLAGMNTAGLGGMTGMDMSAFTNPGTAAPAAPTPATPPAGPMDSNMMQMMVAPVISDALVYFKMMEIVKSVLGPHAHPDDNLLKFAKEKGKSPASIAEMVPYMNMMLELSKTIGIYMPDGNVKTPFVAPDALATPSLGPAPSLADIRKAMTGGTKKPSTQPSIGEVRDLIIQRGILWFKSQKPPPSPLLKF